MVSKLLALEAVITCVWYVPIVAQSYPVYCQKTGYTLTNPLSSNNIAGN